MQTFIEKALDHSPFWDVCCDHGYVGIGALYTKRFSHVHFVDQVPHIIERLDQLIKQSPDFKEDFPYSLHTMSGESLDGDITGTFLIAGVGGMTIKNILSAALKKETLKAQRLLLSPHTDEAVMSAYIMSEDFKTYYSIKERLMLLDGKKHRPLYILDRN
nr:tRNA (adenine(22)-N(1))-methyltransferase TrmK [Bacteriovorax sp. HI3]